MTRKRSNLPRYQIFVGGAWRDPLAGEWFETFDPAAAEAWALIPRGRQEDVERAVEAARAAFLEGPWRKMTASQRGHLLRRLGDAVAARAERLAEVEVRDNGKRIAEVMPQLRYLAETYYYFAGLADKVEGAVIPLDRAGVFNYTRPEPLGVVAAITPWNSPLMLAAWKLAPALAAGNTVVLKPSEHASASTLEFAKLFEEAGVPPGVVNVVTGFGPEAGEPLIAHPKVAKVSFTGSGATGRLVAKLAADGIKRVTLELGGKSPQIVFADADLDNAVNGVVSGIFLSCGQTCVAGSRLLLQDSIHERFLDMLLARVRGFRIGHPMDEATDIGPIANRPQYDKILRCIEEAKRAGATLVAGGGPARGPAGAKGWYVEPTVFTDVRNHMPIARDEVFGPVLAVLRFKDEEEAVSIANDTAFGLAAGVWTKDMRRALLLAERLEAGTVYVNNYRAVAAMSPVGGFKESGYGRENGIEAIREYTQTKSVWLGTADGIPNPFARA